MFSSNFLSFYEFKDVVHRAEFPALRSSSAVSKLV
jgi:hypothetical protein